MKTLIWSVVAIIMIAVLEVACSASATWEVAGTDLFGRTYTGELILHDVSADISLEFSGDDGITLFDNSFARFEEAGASDAEQIVILQDYDGLKGGQLTLAGLNILESQIEIGTQPQLLEASIIVWNGLTAFQSPSNASSIDRTNVSVPEPSGLVAIVTMLCSGSPLLLLMRRK